MRVLTYTCPWPGNLQAGGILYNALILCLYDDPVCSINMIVIVFFILLDIVADHPKSDEYFSDPRLSAYAVPYSRAFTGYEISCRNKLILLVSG